MSNNFNHPLSGSFNGSLPQSPRLQPRQVDLTSSMNMGVLANTGAAANSTYLNNASYRSTQAINSARKKSNRKTGLGNDELEDINDTINHSVQMEAYIWDRDSHGLYDYECKSVVKQALKITGCNVIARKEQEIKTLLPHVDEIEQEQQQNLITLVYKLGQYWLFHSKSLLDDAFKNHADRVWRIVKYEAHHNQKRGNTMKVGEGDVIKFGRVRFRIKKLVVDQGDIKEIDNSSNINSQRGGNALTTLDNEAPYANSAILGNSSGNLNESIDIRNMSRGETQTMAAFDNRAFEFDDALLKQKEQEIRIKSHMINRQHSQKSMKDAQICRICLSEEENNNFLISPCSCTGSMKFIHVNCLKEWLEGKKHMKETPIVNSYIWKNLECEICKTSYTDITTIHKGTDKKEVNLLNYVIHADAKSYMVIESVTNTTSKTIHVINFTAQKKIKVGRGPNAEVRITDISVSRFHTQVKLSKFGEVIISDNSSKFGTLVQLAEPIAIGMGKSRPLYVQIGRSVLVLYSVNRFSCIQRCFGAFSTQYDENCLHFDEVSRFYPVEFDLLFKRYSRKKTKSVNSSMQRPLNGQGADNSNASVLDITSNPRRNQGSALHYFSNEPIRPQANGGESGIFQVSVRNNVPIQPMNQSPLNEVEDTMIVAQGQNTRVDQSIVLTNGLSASQTFVRGRYDENQLSLNIEFTTSPHMNAQQQETRQSQVGNSQQIDPSDLIRVSAQIAIENNDLPLQQQSIANRTRQIVSNFNTGRSQNHVSQLGVLDERKEEEEDDDQVRIFTNRDHDLVNKQRNQQREQTQIEEVKQLSAEMTQRQLLSQYNSIIQIDQEELESVRDPNNRGDLHIQDLEKDERLSQLQSEEEEKVPTTSNPTQSVSRVVLSGNIADQDLSHPRLQPISTFDLPLPHTFQSETQKNAILKALSGLPTPGGDRISMGITPEQTQTLIPRNSEQLGLQSFQRDGGVHGNLLMQSISTNAPQLQQK